MSAKRIDKSLLLLGFVFVISLLGVTDSSGGQNKLGKILLRPPLKYCPGLYVQITRITERSDSLKKTYSIEYLLQSTQKIEVEINKIGLAASKDPKEQVIGRLKSGLNLTAYSRSDAHQKMKSWSAACGLELAKNPRDFLNATTLDYFSLSLFDLQEEFDPTTDFSNWFELNDYASIMQKNASLKTRLYSDLSQIMSTGKDLPQCIEHLLRDSAQSIARGDYVEKYLSTNAKNNLDSFQFTVKDFSIPRFDLSNLKTYSPPMPSSLIDFNPKNSFHLDITLKTPPHPSTVEEYASALDQTQPSLVNRLTGTILYRVSSKPPSGQMFSCQWQIPKDNQSNQLLTGSESKTYPSPFFLRLKYKNILVP